MNTFVCRINDNDTFSVSNFPIVNLNDNRNNWYTLWRTPSILYRLPNAFSSNALDLFYISLMVYYADMSVLRSSQPDAWTRSFIIYMPVLNPSIWDENKDILIRALNYLSGDRWSFVFRPRSLSKDEERYQRGKQRYDRRGGSVLKTDTFCMLSGGLDSFIGAIDLLSEGKRPIFVGCLNGGKGVTTYQNNVRDSLVSHFSLDTKLFYQFSTTPRKESQDAQHEKSTRSRSFYFFSQAILMASTMSHATCLIIPENGFISLNIPLTVHRLGSLSTRTTHPYYLGLLQCLINNLGIHILLHNPYQFKTKGEMIMECKDLDYLKANYQITMSCSHPDHGRWYKRHPQHCGTCLPCTVRRAAILKAGLADTSGYYDEHYNERGAKANLKSFRLCMSQQILPRFAVLQSGPLGVDKDRFADLYQRGLKEISDFIDSL